MATENIITLVLAISGFITGLIVARTKANQSAMDDLAKAVTKLREVLDVQQKTIDDQQATIERLENENNALRERIKELEHRNEVNDAARGCLEDRIKLLEADKVRLEKENTTLLTRISELEKGTKHE